MASSRIICPSIDALALTIKPHIIGAISMGCFKVPEFYMIPTAHKCAISTIISDELMKIQAFCDKIGYPVLMKGVQLGSTICYRWIQVVTYITAQNQRKNS